MSKKADKFIEKYIVGKDDWLLKHKEVISKLLDEYETEQLTIPVVSQQSELLPDFLYEDDGIIKVGVHGDSAVTDEWNDYLKKLGNCG